jgi:hypothetical protein
MNLDWNVSLALQSYATLCGVINRMSEEELRKALEIESSTKRRAAHIDRMISRVVRLNEQRLVAELKSKYART